METNSMQVSDGSVSCRYRGSFHFQTDFYPVKAQCLRNGVGDAKHHFDPVTSYM